MKRHDRYVSGLALLYGAWWLALAVDPHYRDDWAVENVLVLLFVGALAATYRRFRLSRLSYTLIFVFLCLHAVGSHYTYAEVPYDAWFRSLTGHSLNALMGWERNHFDRFVHFMYGLLLVYPIREVFLRIADVRGFWGYFLPLDFAIASSAIYELIEWGAALVFGGELGAAYLGTQGDIWDAQRDMALASLGAFIAMAFTAAVNALLRRDFAEGVRESMRVKHAQPLGEEELERLLRAKR
ncbi:MAG TPA: DUF2238 domain-containing protein [Burkholderiales bacterium]|nr:DUF2238 domain-containing protein [Burkholderiales bacterium]